MNKRSVEGMLRLLINDMQWKDHVGPYPASCLVFSWAAQEKSTAAAAALNVISGRDGYCGRNTYMFTF